MSDFVVEFAIADDDRFRRLAVVFDALRAAKQTDEWHDDEYWLGYFDREARAHFWWPTAAELDDWNRRWFSTPVPDRFTDPTLVTPWGFSSMIDAFRNGDYDLLACERHARRAGRLTFEPHAWPYGGCGCMRALIEAFGHVVTDEPDA
ncbi:MAG: hypothetical protein U0804_04875 [Gemmataceae bacterium]